MNPYDEFLHQIKHTAGQQNLGYRPFIYGHVASYDPRSHRVRVLVPSMRDDLGRPVLSPWMPLGTLWVGNGYGLQIAPHGGATFDDPTAGEPCEVHVMNRQQGTSLAAHLIFNQVLIPPDQALAPGEALMRHETGSRLRFSANGAVDLVSAADLRATAGANLIVTVAGDATATVAGDMTANVSGTASIIAAIKAIVTAAAIEFGNGGTLKGLVTDAMTALFNSHTHSDPQGGTTGSPNQTMGPTQVTSIVKAQ